MLGDSRSARQDNREKPFGATPNARPRAATSRVRRNGIADGRHFCFFAEASASFTHFSRKVVSELIPHGGASVWKWTLWLLLPLVTRTEVE
jgi:hypothetical protein